MEVQYSGGIPIFKGNSIFNNRTLKFKFQCSTKNSICKKIQIEGEIHHSTEYSMFREKNQFNGNSTATLREIQHSIEYSIFNNKNPFNGKFNIQRNIQYSIRKINSTAIQRLFNGNSTTIQRHHDNI